MKDGDTRTGKLEHLNDTPDAEPLSRSVELSHPYVEFDPAEFVHFLAETGWTDEQKAEYAKLVWDIVCEFVAMGFGVHPLQQAQNSGGKLPEPGDEAPGQTPEMVHSSHGQLIKQFMRSEAAETHQGEKESP